MIVFLNGMPTCKRCPGIVRQHNQRYAPDGLCHICMIRARAVGYRERKKPKDKCRCGALALEGIVSDKLRPLCGKCLKS